MGLPQVQAGRVVQRPNLLRGSTTFLTPSRQATKGFIRLILFIFLTFFPFYISSAQDSKSPDPDTSVGHFPVKLANDLSHVFSLDSVPTLAIGGTLTAFDWGAYDDMNHLAPDLVKWNAQPLFDFGNFYGEGWVEGGAALGSWGLGALIQDPKLQQFGRDASESLIEATALVTGVKVVINRTRPDGGNYSFPSGHSITAFCVAPVVGKYWGWEAGAGAYLLATVTALARVEGYHHYLSDTIAGATLGIILGNAATWAPKDVSVSAGLGRMSLKLAFN